MKRAYTLILLLALLVAGGLSLLASQAPDGLEWSLQRFQPPPAAETTIAPFPDYEVPWIPPSLRGSAAGLIGVGAVLLALTLAGFLLTSRRKGSTSPR